MKYRLQKGFINKSIKPVIGTPDFLKIVDIISTVTTYNKQYYGETLRKIYETYMFNAWLPSVIFKLGYIQALVDAGQKVEFCATYSDSDTVKKAYQLFMGIEK